MGSNIYNCGADGPLGQRRFTTTYHTHTSREDYIVIDDSLYKRSQARRSLVGEVCPVGTKERLAKVERLLRELENAAWKARPKGALKSALAETNEYFANQGELDEV